MSPIISKREFELLDCIERHKKVEAGLMNKIHFLHRQLRKVLRNEEIRMNEIKKYEYTFETIDSIFSQVEADGRYVVAVEVGPGLGGFTAITYPKPAPTEDKDVTPEAQSGECDQKVLDLQ